MLKHSDLTYTANGCAMEVHRDLGPGLDERFYHLALCDALREHGVSFQCKPKGTLVHKGIAADEFEADLLVENTVILELKVLEGGFAPAHVTQLICYLKFWQKDLGVLLDFGKESLARKRVPYTVRRGSAELSSLADELPRLASADQELARAIAETLRSLHEEYGLGYRDTTYNGLLRAELTAQGMPLVQAPRASLSVGRRSLGVGELPCLVVADRCVVQVYALYDSLHAWQRARTQACVAHLGMPFGIVGNFGKRDLEVRLVWRDCDSQTNPLSP